MGFRKSITACTIAVEVHHGGVSPTERAEAAPTQCGGASWYNLGSRTASGERMSSGAMAAAHRTLPFGTHVKVQNLGNGRAVVVRINDRGPFVRGRVIDLTRAQPRSSASERHRAGETDSGRRSAAASPGNCT